MFAPTPYPDEVLGSTLARACIWYGLRPTQLFKRVIRKSAQTSYFLPNSIHSIAKWLGSTPEALLQEHTMLPYCAAFADASTRLRSPFFFLSTCTRVELFPRLRKLHGEGTERTQGELLASLTHAPGRHTLPSSQRAAAAGKEWRSSFMRCSHGLCNASLMRPYSRDRSRLQPPTTWIMDCHIRQHIECRLEPTG